MSFAAIPFFQLAKEVNSTSKWVQVRQTHLSDLSFSDSFGDELYSWVFGGVGRESVLHWSLLLGFEINIHHSFSTFILFNPKPSFTYLDILIDTNLGLKDRKQAQKIIEWFVPWSCNLKKFGVILWPENN